MRSSSMLTSLSTALAITLLSSYGATQAPQPAPLPPPPAPAPAPAALHRHPLLLRRVRQPVPAPATPGAQPAPGAAQPGTPARACTSTRQPVLRASPRRSSGCCTATRTVGPTSASQRTARGFERVLRISVARRRGAAAGADLPAAEETQDDRVRSLQEQNSMYGATGLLRTVCRELGRRWHLPRPPADRLVPDELVPLLTTPAPCRCPTPARARHPTPTPQRTSAANVGLSVTPVDFLEAYATIRSRIELERSRPSRAPAGSRRHHHRRQGLHPQQARPALQLRRRGRLCSS